VLIKSIDQHTTTDVLITCDSMITQHQTSQESIRNSLDIRDFNLQCSHYHPPNELTVMCASFSIAVQKQWPSRVSFISSREGVFRIDCTCFDFKIGHCQDPFTELFY